MTRARGALLALIGGVAASLLLGELVLRIADAAGRVRPWREAREARAASIWMPARDPALIYRHRPGYVKDGVRQTEAHGILRPDDVSLRPGPGVYRIAAVGDSLIAALALAYEDRLPARLEAALSTDEQPVEVLNFGVNGYDTLQQAALVDALVLDFAPDLLLLHYCINDFHPTRYPTRWFLARHPSRLLAFAGIWLDPLLDGYPPAAHWERQYREDARGWQRVRGGFARIARAARARDLPVLLVIFPLVSHEGWRAGDAAGRHARVAELGREAGFEVLDLLPVFARHPIESLRLEPWDTFHFNARGHRLAAEAVAARLRERGLASGR